MIHVILLVASLAPQSVQGHTLSRPLDRDGDGRVTRAEFRAHTDGSFNAMDRNGDGVLAADELRLSTIQATPVVIDRPRAGVPSRSQPRTAGPRRN